MDAVEGHGDGGLGSDNLLLGLLPFLEDVLQHKALGFDGAGERRVSLLGTHAE